MAEAEGVDLLALDERAARDGIARWHDPALWHRAKQEISPDRRADVRRPGRPTARGQAGALLQVPGARSRQHALGRRDRRRRAWKASCSARAARWARRIVAFQDYARELTRRGVILAVCSKNDEANALEPFEQHPDMVLRRGDIACFVANWSDKAANIRAIAEELNIGLDSLVFVDDNPFERNLVRQRTADGRGARGVGRSGATIRWRSPMPAISRACRSPTRTASATGQYQGNQARDALKASATDLPSLSARAGDAADRGSRFDRVGLQRIVQLINKTNQFNLTTRRYTEEEVLAVMADPARVRAAAAPARPVRRQRRDRHRHRPAARATETSTIDTWLMSCRVLGRQVEPTTLNLIARAGAGSSARGGWSASMSRRRRTAW